MITPAYSPTATERVLPRLALDFTTGVLDSRVTVTRLLNTATRINASGFIETVNANLPRFDYDPVTLAPKGLLIEETRANLLANSNDFANGTYWAVNGTPTILANQVSSPDGTTNACTMEVTGASSGFGVYNTISYAAGTYTATLYFKRISGNIVVRLGFGGNSSRIDITTLAIIDGTNSVGTVALGPNGFYRFTVVATTTASSPVNIYSIGSNTGKMAFYGCQVEAAAFATSYIPTTTTSLTRNADVAIMTGTDFSSWYNQSQGSFVAEFIPTIIGGPTVYAATDGTINNRIQGPASDVAQFLVSSDGALQALLDGGTIPPAGISKIASAYAENSFALSLNAGTVATGTTGTPPVVDRFSIGSLIGNQEWLNGHIRAVRYYPLRLTNAEIQAFSKG